MQRKQATECRRVSVAHWKGEQLATKIAAEGCKTCPSKYSPRDMYTMNTNAEHGKLPGLTTSEQALVGARHKPTTANPLRPSKHCNIDDNSTR